MVKARYWYKLHKFLGLSAGWLIFLLAFSGFFLDHKTWHFLHTVTFEGYSQALQKNTTSAYIEQNEHIIVGDYRGLFESFDGGQSFKKSLNETVFGVAQSGKSLYAATQRGLFEMRGFESRCVAFCGQKVHALNQYKDLLVLAVDKKVVALFDTQKQTLIKSDSIAYEKPPHSEVSLGRIVRDLHYGRGLFEGYASLLLNDMAALIMLGLAFTGYLAWYLLKKKKGKRVRALIKWHAHGVVLVFVAPIVILALTGIFLDHAKALGAWMHTIKIPNFLVPPLYSSLKEDIWSVDYDGRSFRIGNRNGVYESHDLKHFKLRSKGFGYKMIRLNDRLYISGMGSANRLIDESGVKVLEHTPHMFKAVREDSEGVHFLGMGQTDGFKLPHFETLTLYEWLLALHDGRLFASWWIWINDIAALFLLFLLLSGIIRRNQRGVKR